MKVVAIIGSIREESYNKKLAEYLKNRYEDKFELVILNLKELPFFSEDIEKNPPLSVVNFRDEVSSSDAVLWITPEYNGTIPGVLGNSIDWLSRGDKVLAGKPSWVMGASMGQLGTVKAQLHLREILFSLSSPLLPSNEVYVGSIHNKLSKDNTLNDQATIDFIDLVTSNFLSWVNKIQG